MKMEYSMTEITKYPTLDIDKLQKLRRIVNELVAAELDYSWRGTKEPEDIKEIELKRKKVRRKYNAYVRTL